MAMGDPNMLLRLMSQQQAAAAAGGMFGAQPGQAGMFGLGAGITGAAGLSAANYLNMAQQAGGAPGAADMQQSMMPGMMGAAQGGGAVLNPFARPGKPPKQRKSKNKPKRPLSRSSTSAHWSSPSERCDPGSTRGGLSRRSSSPALHRLAARA